MVRHRGLVRLSDLSKVLPLATWLQAKDCGPGSLIPVCILLTTPLFHVYYLSVQTGVSENGVFSGSPRQSINRVTIQTGSLGFQSLSLKCCWHVLILYLCSTEIFAFSCGSHDLCFVCLFAFSFPDCAYLSVKSGGEGCHLGHDVMVLTVTGQRPLA